jgi:hypothetical protein
MRGRRRGCRGRASEATAARPAGPHHSSYRSFTLCEVRRMSMVSSGHVVGAPAASPWPAPRDSTGFGSSMRQCLKSSPCTAHGWSNSRMSHRLGIRLPWRTTDSWSVIAPMPPRFRQAAPQRSEKGLSSASLFSRRHAGTKPVSFGFDGHGGCLITHWKAPMRPSREAPGAKRARSPGIMRQSRR